MIFRRSIIGALLVILAGLVPLKQATAQTKSSRDCNYFDTILQDAKSIPADRG